MLVELSSSVVCSIDLEVPKTQNLLKKNARKQKSTFFIQFYTFFAVWKCKVLKNLRFCKKIGKQYKMDNSNCQKREYKSRTIVFFYFVAFFQKQVFFFGTFKSIEYTTEELLSTILYIHKFGGYEYKGIRLLKPFEESVTHRQ